MRIGIDCRLWNQTGVGRYIRNLVKNLQEIDEKNEYTLFVRDEDYKNLETQISNSKWKIIRVNIRWHTIAEQTKFASILKKENLDLVHFPYFSVPIFYNKPFVVTIHDLIVHHFSTGKASALILPLYKIKLISYKVIIKKAAQRAKKIIAVSVSTKQEVMDHLKINSNKITVIYNGIDENLLKLPKHENLIKDEYFLYVGNAYPHKNLERLLQAFEIFSKENKNIKLVLVGKEDYFYKNLKIENNNVLCFGDSNDENLVNLYRNAKALILPSLMEGFGLTAVEAMMNRCPVLASDIPSLREICETAAIYFDPLDVNDLVKNLKLIINDSVLRKKNIRKGVKQAQKFSWKKSAQETLKVYESSISLR